MSDPVTSIRNALERALGAMTPQIPTVHQNEGYEPQTGVAYQECYLLRGDPDNSTLGQGYYQERGVFQVTLKYLLGQGTADCETRAGMIRTLFARGATFTADDIAVQVDTTPTITAGMPDGDAWSQSVKVRWHADVMQP
jgi:hypothetical protein